MHTATALLTDAVIDPTEVALTNVVAVLPDRIVAEATVVVRDGVIVEIAEAGAAPFGAIDCHGSYCAPGLVDTHSDGLEKELRPRPGVLLPIEFALRSFEGRVRGAGVTTIFHGVGFETSSKYDRSVAQAHAMCDTIDERASSGSALVDHRILHRLDVRDAEGLGALRTRVDASLDSLPLVSYEDHTPGRGQYTDRKWFERYVAGTRGLDERQAKEYIDGVIEERDANLTHRDIAVPWLGERARVGELRLMCHDPAEVDEIDEAVTAGVAIAEFPTTVAAGRAARERGLWNVCGGPNALRGESHSGNVSAREMISLGLCDGLASDYLPSTLLGAVGVLVATRICDLAGAIRLVTAGPADLVGLDDRGRLEPGRRGDLVVFDLDGALPTVRLVIGQAHHSLPAMAPTDPTRGTS